jgi:hypothetical protein
MVPCELKTRDLLVTVAIHHPIGGRISIEEFENMASQGITSENEPLSMREFDLMYWRLLKENQLK